MLKNFFVYQKATECTTFLTNTLRNKQCSEKFAFTESNFATLAKKFATLGDCCAILRVICDLMYNFFFFVFVVFRLSCFIQKAQVVFYMNQSWIILFTVNSILSSNAPFEI